MSKAGKLSGKQAKLNSKKAGKASGIKRAKQATLRRFSVLNAFARLKPTHQMQPYSNGAINALEKELRKHPPEFTDEDGVVVRSWSWRDVQNVRDLTRPPPAPKLPPDIEDKLVRLLDEVIPNIIEDESLLQASIRAPNRDTLINDLKALGIRSKRRKKRSG